MSNSRRPQPHPSRHLSRQDQDKTQSLAFLQSRLSHLLAIKERKATEVLVLLSEISALKKEIESRGEPVGTPDEISEFLQWKRDQVAASREPEDLGADFD
ncbi:MAG: hypothetical protein KGJ01_02455 [Patescibacteria group bacterium]|nr:hypothetical protein [Patescibacteria group bacterium]